MYMRIMFDHNNVSEYEDNCCGDDKIDDKST